MLPDCDVCKFKSVAIKELNSEQITYLQNNCSRASFKKGETIFKEGALSLNIAYILTGLTKIHMKGIGEQEQIIKLVKAPNYIGIPTSLGDKINKYSVTALEETTVCFIGLETFKNLLLDNKEFSYKIIIDLCQKELDNFKSCMHKIQKQSAGLLADTLLEFSCFVYDNPEFEIPLTRQEIADLIGTSRENVSRTLSNFQKNKIIKIDKQKIKILDLCRLEKISNYG